MSGRVFVFVLAGTKTKLLEPKYSNPTAAICDIILKYWLQVLSGHVLGEFCVLLLLLIDRLALVTVVQRLKMNNNRVDWTLDISLFSCRWDTVSPRWTQVNKKGKNLWHIMKSITIICQPVWGDDVINLQIQASPCLLLLLSHLYWGFVTHFTS